MCYASFLFWTNTSYFLSSLCTLTHTHKHNFRWLALPSLVAVVVAAPAAVFSFVLYFCVVSVSVLLPQSLPLPAASAVV